jgi:IS4 transposase
VGWNGAVKLHLMLDHDGLLPSYAVISDGKQHEITVTRQWEFAPGTVLVFDRGYNDYDWFEQLARDGVFFVTRMKDNADYIAVEKRPLPQRKGLRGDQIICMTQQAAGSDNPPMMRRIEFFDEEQQRTLVFLTNNLKPAATTVAEIYKNRWQIKLFFKALKQSCKVKTFVGTSANALKTQIWTALIAILLVKILHMKSRFGWHLSNFCVLLRQQLFVYRDLWKWIDDPFQTPETAPPSQMELLFG